jgi:Zn-dependent metalloprotease
MHSNRILIKWLITIGIAVSATRNISAQIYDTNYVASYDTLNYWLTFKQSPLTNDKSAILATVFPMEECEFRLRSQYQESESNQHYIYSLYYNNVEVLGHDISVHKISENYSANGRLVKGSLDCNVDSSNYTSEALINIAKSFLEADTTLDIRKYLWQDSSYEAAIKERMQDTLATYYPSPVSCIYQNEFCKKLTIFVKEPFATFEFIVNCNNGSILKYEEVSCGMHPRDLKKKSSEKTEAEPMLPERHWLTCSGTGCSSGGSADVRFYGTQSIDTDKFQSFGSCYWRTKNTCLPSFIYVREDESWGLSDISYSSNSWGSNQIVGTTALFCAQETYDYFYSKFNRNSWDNNYAQLDISVDADDIVATSLWNGTSIVLGVAGTSDGKTATSDVLCLETIGHEFTHGVIQISSTLPTNGSIAEGICDIFSHLIGEYAYLNHSITGWTQNYIIADEVFNGGLRDMSAPNNTGEADTWGGTNWGINKYKDAGILRYWYYLLCMGNTVGNSQNDFNVNFCVKSIGPDKVGKILYTALLGGYLNSNTTYDSFRASINQCASGIYGNWSPEVAEIEAAFHAVGLGNNGVNGASAAGPQANIPYVLIGNKTETSTQQYHFKNKIQHENYIVNNQTILVSSQSEVVVRPGTDIYSSYYRAYIATACDNGLYGARTHNTIEEPIQLPTVFPDNRRLSSQTNMFIAVPNPTSAEVVFSAESILTGDVRISIMNSLGQIVFDQLSENENNIRVNFSAFPNALYFVRIYTATQTQVIKVVRN